MSKDNENKDLPDENTYATLSMVARYLAGAPDLMVACQGMVANFACVNGEDDERRTHEQ